MATASPLSYEQAPPFSLPLRFFMTAPLFAAAAGLLMVLDGGQVFASRWMPAALAATHLITVGFMLMIMIGGLLQVLPVVVGVQLLGVRTIGPLIHIALTAGAILLPLAFLWRQPGMFQLAALLLGGAVLLFLVSGVHGMLTTGQATPSVVALKFSLLGLAVTIALGALLALGLGRGWLLPYLEVTDLHAAWGLAVWSGLLLAALSYLVVPMFQLTPPYARQLPGVLLAGSGLGIAGWSLGVIVQWPWLISLAACLLSLAAAAYALQTLYLLQRRRRARRDASLGFWQLGLSCMLVAVLLLPLGLILPVAANAPAWALSFGVLLGIGGFMSLMCGMLYKIVPFLAWLHLQDLGRARRKVPSMAAMLPEPRMRWQLRAHIAAVLSLLLAPHLPEMAWLAGLLLMLSSLVLFANLLTAALAYRRAAAQIDSGNAAGPT